MVVRACEMGDSVVVQRSVKRDDSASAEENFGKSGEGF
jgi:hypothetical protein